MGKEGEGNTEGGDKGSGPSAEQYAQWAAQTAELAMQIKLAQEKKNAIMSQTGCKKPLIMKSKKGRAYLECLANNKAKIEAAKEADRELVRMRLRLQELNAKRGSGLSTGAWIGISVGVALLIGTVIVVAVKMNKNN